MVGDGELLKQSPIEVNADPLGGADLDFGDVAAVAFKGCGEVGDLDAGAFPDDPQCEAVDGDGAGGGLVGAVSVPWWKFGHVCQGSHF